MAVTLRPARMSELSILSDLCRASKAYWGYDAAFMAACHDEFAVTTDMLPDLIVAQAEDGGPVGVVAVTGQGPTVDLEKFFVAPERIGTGVGRLLFEGAMAEARRRDASIVEIESDPDARAFYERMGAVPSGSAPSGSIPGRMLPKLTLHLTKAGAT